MIKIRAGFIETLMGYWVNISKIEIFAISETSKKHTSYFSICAYLSKDTLGFPSVYISEHNTREEAKSTLDGIMDLLDYGKFDSPKDMDKITVDSLRLEDFEGLSKHLTEPEKNA